MRAGIRASTPAMSAAASRTRRSTDPGSRARVAAAASKTILSLLTPAGGRRAPRVAWARSAVAERQWWRDRSGSRRAQGLKRCRTRYPHPPRPLEVTEDTVLNGRVRLRQPVAGYRAGMDAALLAAACDAGPDDRVIEAGCGVGGALLAAAARRPGARFVGTGARSRRRRPGPGQRRAERHGRPGGDHRGRRRARLPGPGPAGVRRGDRQSALLRRSRRPARARPGEVRRLDGRRRAGRLDGVPV